MRPPLQEAHDRPPHLIITDWSTQTSLLLWSQNVHSWDPNIRGAACKEKLHPSHIRFPSWCSRPQENNIALPPGASALRGHGFPASAKFHVPRVAHSSKANNGSSGFPVSTLRRFNWRQLPPRHAPPGNKEPCLESLITPAARGASVVPGARSVSLVTSHKPHPGS